MTIEVGTPLWSGGFGCVTWAGEQFVGIAMLDRGEPKVRAWVSPDIALRLAQQFADMVASDGRVVDGLGGRGTLGE